MKIMLVGIIALLMAALVINLFMVNPLVGVLVAPFAGMTVGIFADI